MAPLECMPQSARLSVGLTMSCPATMDTQVGTTAPTGDTPPMSARTGWTTP